MYIYNDVPVYNDIYFYIHVNKDEYVFNDVHINYYVYVYNDVYVSFDAYNDAPVMTFLLMLQTDIATKLSFKRKHLTLMRHDYYRPRVNILTPSANLAVPDAFTQYLSNVFYTRHIGEQ